MVQGLQSGLSTGLMVTFILWFLQPQTNPLVLLPGALLIGILIGIAFAAIGYAASRGKRDFNSISQTVANKYELLCEHKVAGQARELLTRMPGARAAAFDPRNQPWQPPQQQYPSQAGYPQQPYGQPPAQQAPYGQQQTYGQPQAYGQAPTQDSPQQAPSQPSAESYDRGEGIGRAPSSDHQNEQDGRTPRGDNRASNVWSGEAKGPPPVGGGPFLGSGGSALPGVALVEGDSLGDLVGERLLLGVPQGEQPADHAGPRVEQVAHRTQHGRVDRRSLAAVGHHHAHLGDLVAERVAGGGEAVTGVIAPETEREHGAQQVRHG